MAIILLTVAIKIAFWQLTAKQYESMAVMKIIQPKVQALQKKHAKDPQTMQKETMALYKEHGVNPFSGCLPMLIQLPIMIGLYSVLTAQAFLAKTAGKGFLWIQNISFVETVNFSAVPATNPLVSVVHSLGLTGSNTALIIGGFSIPVLAALVAITTYYSQKMMDLPKEQQSMMVFMPIMMLFICSSLNAGVNLYWVISNVLMIVQQSYMKKEKPVKEKLATVEISKN